ncbi:MAG: VPLPA-CTERM sorting domain-containing protein [Alphaproteobacteria bacterium]|nr:MAG: VPLPA-CTERM sorting domain-containing protein [Alphaproteobacteria bacterium]
MGRFVSLCAGLLMLSAGAAVAEPLVPQVDFRSTEFAGADQQHSVTSAVDGVSFTVSAWRDDGAGGLVAANLWWDNVDGLGIRGGEEDEIDVGEYLVIDFASLVGVSHLFFSDLFANETSLGQTFSEALQLTTDFGFSSIATADLIAGNWGNAGNGEAVLTLDKTIPVRRLTLTGSGLFGLQDFSLLGFIDPVVQIPVPASGLLFLGGLLGLGAFRRRQRAGSAKV